MANQIRLKRGSGSDPGASDLSVGEVAIRTDNGKLFTKKDNGTMKQVALSDLVTFLEDVSASSFDIDGGSY